jgi:hypothetical protein
MKSSDALPQARFCGGMILAREKDDSHKHRVVCLSGDPYPVAGRLFLKRLFTLQNAHSFLQTEDAHGVASEWSHLA